MDNINNEKVIKKKKIVLLISFVLIVFAIIGVTFAYYKKLIGPGIEINALFSSTRDSSFSFSVGNPINIKATQNNFTRNDSNLSSSTTASATLTSSGASLTQTYNVYLKINSNNFIYTTAPTNTPELLLKVTNPNNNTQTISTLTSATSGGITGYDITTKTGLIQIASNYSITTTSSKTDTWTVQVYFINLATSQKANAGKTFNAEVIIQKEEIISYLYWNANFNGTNYIQTSVPSTTYSTSDGLKNGYGVSSFNNNPVFVKTTQVEQSYTGHAVCLYNNNNEFCLGANYWVGDAQDQLDGTTTKAKLKADMENLLEITLYNSSSEATAAGHTGYYCDSSTNSANCIVGSYSCYAVYSGYVGCDSFATGHYCSIANTGTANCS